VIRTFLEWVTELPWGNRTEDKLDLKVASEILEEDHYGLEDVKDRVLEFLAVRKLQTERALEDAEEEKATEEMERAAEEKQEAADEKEEATEEKEEATEEKEEATEEKEEATEEKEEATDPPLWRPSWNGENQHRPVHRQGSGTEIRSHFPGRCPGRSRHPWAPAYLRGCHAWSDHPGDAAGEEQEPGLPPGRGGQAGCVLPG
jgi:hypothetical protein